VDLSLSDCVLHYSGRLCIACSPLLMPSLPDYLYRRTCILPLEDCLFTLCGPVPVEGQACYHPMEHYLGEDLGGTLPCAMQWRTSLPDHIY